MTKQIELPATVAWLLTMADGSKETWFNDPVGLDPRWSDVPSRVQAVVLREDALAAIAKHEEDRVVGEPVAPTERTGNVEVDTVLDRLNSSDPDFDDCAAAAALIYKLEIAHRGPAGFATWEEAAMHERMQRLASPPAPQEAQAEPAQWIDDPHDIEQGQMLNPEWLKLHGTPQQRAFHGLSTAKPAQPATEQAEAPNPLADYHRENFEHAHNGWEACKQECDRLRDELEEATQPTASNAGELPPDEGRGLNPHYAGNFDGETAELADLRRSLASEIDRLLAALASKPVAPPEREALSEFNRAIDHAISLGLEGASFLECWREGNWRGCEEFNFKPNAALSATTPAPAGQTDKVLAYLDELKDDAAAHIFPSDLEKCATSECVVGVTSVRAGNPYERTVPLFSRDQVAEALRAARGDEVKP